MTTGWRERSRVKTLHVVISGQENGGPSDIVIWPRDSAYQGGCAGLGESHLDRGVESGEVLRSWLTPTRVQARISLDCLPDLSLTPSSRQSGYPVEYPWDGISLNIYLESNVYWPLYIVDMKRAVCCFMELLSKQVPCNSCNSTGIQVRQATEWSEGYLLSCKEG